MDTKSSADSPGKVITFYSYKGGTGRTMALANVACLLAERQAEKRSKAVLVIDWDLEAPGLHRYFRDRFKLGFSAHLSTEDAIEQKPGLIDIAYELQTELSAQDELSGTALGKKPDHEKLAQAVIDKVKPEEYAIETRIPSLYMIKAGRFDRKDPEAYPRRVNSFRWEALYRQSPMLIRLLVEQFAKKYEYILIDSRTGVTDVSGICTMLMAEKLVVVFTPNLQSLLGGLQQTRSAIEYRRESSDLRPLIVYPLPSRVEANEPTLRKQWRFGGDSHIRGYQPEFERLFGELYRDSEIQLSDYFDEVQIQQIPRYAYGEEIAVLSEEVGDRFSLKRSYENFTISLVDQNYPWAKAAHDREGGFLRERSLFDMIIIGTAKFYSFATKPRMSWVAAAAIAAVVAGLASYQGVLLRQAAMEAAAQSQMARALAEEQAKRAEEAVKAATASAETIEKLNQTIVKQNQEIERLQSSPKTRTRKKVQIRDVPRRNP